MTFKRRYIVPIGSSFDDFLKKEGILEYCELKAKKEILTRKMHKQKNEKHRDSPKNKNN